MSIRKAISAGLALGIGFVLVVGGWAQEKKGEHAHPAGTPAHKHAKAPVRITMEELHKHGGVPPGWSFTLPVGDPSEGKKVYVAMKCFTCHEIKGEHFPPEAKKPGDVGPELTGMGRHHPAEYFAEAILHPNAVIVLGEGYTGPDGLSRMPEYNDTLTLKQLFDLVAYLKSLGGTHGHHAPAKPHEGGKPHGHGQPGTQKDHHR